MNSPDKSVSELMAQLEALGVTKEEVDAHLQAADAERAMLRAVGPRVRPVRGDEEDARARVCHDSDLPAEVARRGNQIVGRADVDE